MTEVESFEETRLSDLEPVSGLYSSAGLAIWVKRHGGVERRLSTPASLEQPT